MIKGRWPLFLCWFLVADSKSTFFVACMVVSLSLNCSVTLLGQPENTDSLSADPHYRPGPRNSLTEPSTDHPENKIKKNKNKDFPYCLSNKITSVGEISNVTLGKCSKPEFSLGRKLYHWHSTLPFFLCGNKYIRKTGKSPMKVRNVEANKRYRQCRRNKHLPFIFTFQHTHRKKKIWYLPWAGLEPTSPWLKGKNAR